MIIPQNFELIQPTHSYHRQGPEEGERAQPQSGWPSPEKKLPGAQKKVPTFTPRCKVTESRKARIVFLQSRGTQMLHGMGIFTYMKGEKWPHEQGEMAW